jgi:hypothetical protein
VSVDIIVKRAKKIESPKRLRGRQVLAREQDRGPVTLRVPLMMYRASERQNRQIGRSWVIECRTPAAVAYVRVRINELMRELHRTVVIECNSPAAYT